MKTWLLLILSISTLAWAKPAQRMAGENWKQAHARLNQQRGIFPQPQSAWNETAIAQGGPLKNINFATVPNVGNNENLFAIFKYLRDTRFIFNPRSPIHQRRISWKFPDDGCYVRAELMTTFMEAKNLPQTQKLFVFGNLAVKTPNTEAGMARWWYHVAPLVRVQEVVYVLDPSIDYNKPLTVLQWKQLMSAEGGGPEQFAICSGHTFEPDSNCLKPHLADHQMVLYHQKTFQHFEWQRLLDLGRDPVKEL